MANDTAQTYSGFEEREIIPLTDVPQPTPAGPLACRMCGTGRLQPNIEFGRELYLAWEQIVAQLHWCPECGHRQFLPDLSSNDLAKIYTVAYFQSESDRKAYKTSYKSGITTASEQIHALLRRLGIKKGARVHEFGCGTGINMWGLQKVGYDASGSDWSPEAVAFARERGNDKITLEDMTTIDEAAKSGVRYDVIVSNAAIEHTPDPVAMLASMARLCTPKTVIIVRTNNGDGAVNKKLGMHFDGFFYFPHHIHYFSARSLTAAAERAGLKPVLERAAKIFEPLLADAALGQLQNGESKSSRIKRAAAAFETMWLESAFVLADSPIGRAQTELPPVVPSPTAPRVNWDSHQDFFKPGKPWRQHRCRAGDFAAMEEMVYSTLHNIWYYGSAFIGDHYLAHYSDGFLPMLSFHAPYAGRYEFNLRMGLRFSNDTATRVWIVAPGIAPEGLLVDGLAPVVSTRTFDLAAGASVSFVNEALRQPNTQKTTVLVGVRHL